MNVSEKTVNEYLQRKQNITSLQPHLKSLLWGVQQALDL